MALEGILPMVGQLAAAAVCGALIGWEREARHKAAGLKTLTLVSLGAASFAMVGVHLYDLGGPRQDQALDATRVIAGVMQGIGFLGAGAIIQSRGNVSGLTTAATIWIAGALGAACGFGAFGIAIVTTIFALAVLILLSSLEDVLFSQNSSSGARHADRGPPGPGESS